MKTLLQLLSEIKYDNLEDYLISENEIILSELLNPNNSYEYSGQKGFFTYNDANNVTFFVRLTYQPLKIPYFELKTGWLDSDNKPMYEPSIPPISPNSSTIDWDKRSNTVAKIYRDEILPFFESQNLSDMMYIKPISKKRSLFAKRMVDKFTDLSKFVITDDGVNIKITKLV